MIERMKFLSITGPKEDIDRVVHTYLNRYPIHLENALTELSLARDLYPYVQANPYRDVLNKTREFSDLLPDGEGNAGSVATMEVEDAVNFVNDLERQMRQLRQEQDALEEQFREASELLRQITPYRALTLEVSQLLKFKFIKYRFGKIPVAGYERFKSYVYESMNIIFCKSLQEKDYVWGIYFVPEPELERVDAIMSTLHFERVYIPDKYKGTGSEAYENLKQQCAELEKAINEKKAEISNKLKLESSKLTAAQAALEELTFNFDVRKVAAVTQEKEHTFYILCGWMTEDDAENFQKEIEDDGNIYVIVENGEENLNSTPPTKLKNPGFAKPFEMYTRMYGLPSYKEMDPTIFVALTYSFLFGAMFGDLGQGLCLLIGGMLLYRFKKMDLAGIIGTAGIFSSIFGVLFGSFFGFENLFDAVWLRPKEAMMKVPFIGNLNTVFVVAIAFGMFLVLVTMIFNMINAWKRNEIGDFLFDTNGLAGFVFYGSLVLVLVLFMTGRAVPAGAVLALMFLVPLVFLAAKEPLTNLIKGERPLIEATPVMFVMETFFELFEVMLSFFSNTLSFVRVGAFAVSHAAMMEVVLMLAGAENGGNPNWIVVVLGNIFVCGLEGLIVGIQVLRLEYYELFSRYYHGDGREFKPFGKRS